MKHICVFGSVDERIDDKYKEKGFELGRKIAKENYGLIYSGMKTGVSGAVAKGVAEEENMPIIGIMPDAFKKIRVNEIFEGCTEKIFTKDLAKRIELMILKSDAIIITPGGIGTLYEFFNTICNKGLGFITKPIVIYDIDNYYKKIIEFLDHSIEENFVRKEYKEIFKVFDNIEDVFKYINNYNFNI